MNLIMVSGRITKDIELRQTKSGKNYILNSIAVRKSRKNAEGNYDSDFFDFEVWNATAEYLATRAKKGSRIEILGELQNNNYQKEDGSIIYKNRIVVNRLEIIDYTESNQSMQQAQQFQQQSFQSQQTFEQPMMNGFGSAMQQTAPTAGIKENNLPF